MKLTLIALVFAFVLSACGKAQFAGDSDIVPTTSVPILATGTDYYIEIGQSFSQQIQGDIDLTNVQVFGNATWPGLNTLQFEMRAALSGTTPSGGVSVAGSQPATWSTATPVLNVTLPAGANKYQLLSVNLKDSAKPFLTNGQFWILIRVRYAGLDLSKSLTLENIYVHAEGEKSLSGLAPIINLGW